MKNVLTIALVLLGASIAGVAQPPHAKAHGKHKGKSGKQVTYRYYYYPQQQVYFNTVTGVYGCWQNGQWVAVKKLPPGLMLKGKPRVVYYEHPTIWVQQPKPSVQINIQANL